MSSNHTGNVQPSIDLEEHRSKNLNAKAVVVHGYIPGTDQYVPITATDNGDGTYSLKTTATISGGAAAYSTNDIEDGVTSYFGKSTESGVWLVQKVTDTAVSYATALNNALVTTYTDAWTNRATLTYGRFDEAF